MVQKRIKIERKIVRRTVEAFLAAGYTLSVNNGGDSNECPYTSDSKIIFDAMMETDDEQLLVRKGTYNGMVYFVYGNDGYDVICDYSGSLETILDPVNQYAESLDENA